MLTDIYDIQAYAATLTKHARTVDGKNFVVKFDGNGGPPRTRVTESSVEIILPKMNAKMSDRDANLARWYMVHEIAHHTEGPEIFDIMNDNALDPEKSPLAGVLNCFEDGRIEKSDSQKYAGDAKVFSSAMDTMLSEMLPKLKKEDTLKNPEMQKLAACTIAELEARSDWNFGAANNYHDMEELLGEEGKDALKKLRDSGMVDVLRNLKSEHESLEAAKKAYELVWEESADDHIEEQKEQQKQEQGEGDGDSDGEGSEGSEGDGEGKGKDAKGKGSKGEGKGEQQGKGKGERVNELESDGGTVNYLDLLNSKAPSNDEDGPSASGITLDYTEYMSKGYDGAYEPTPLKDVRVAWFHKNKYSHSDMASGGRGGRYEDQIQRECDEVHARHGEPGKGFGNKVRRHLQILAQSRYVGGHRRGKLHRKSAYKIGVPQVGNGEWNSKVFRQKHKQDILDVAVCVLTDFSGSMMGSKVAHAIDSAILLNNSIGTSLHIPLQLLTFTEARNNCFIGVVKDFDDRIPEEKVREYMLKSGNYMSGNPDGDAVMWAYKALRGRKEKRKILIVLSDGSPASSRPGDDMAFVKTVVKEIEDEGVVEIVGLGIKDRNVKHIYSQNETIKKADELENAVLNLVKKQIIKH